MKTLFLVNARSGAKRGYDVSELIREIRNDAEIVACQRKEDLDGIIDQAERDGFSCVYAVGGDGTVHEIAKRMIGRTMALGVLPTGSGNGFARHIGLPVEPRASLLSCAAGRVTMIDTAAVNGNPFLGVMGVGFDAFIADRFAASHVRGMQTYVREGILGFAGYTPEEYDIEIDGAATHRRAFVVAVANSSQYGNNARIAPLASLQDGLLDVTIVHDATLLTAPLMLARLFSGTLHQSNSVTTAQGARVTIRRPSPGPAHLDGEPVTLPEVLDVQVNRGSLRLLVPDGVERI